MSKIIVKQPNGLFCLYSSIVDNITHFNMTPKDIIEYYLEQSKEDIEERVHRNIEKIEKGKVPKYYGNDFTYEAMINSIKEMHGEEESSRVSELINLKPNTESKHPFDAKLNIENAYQSFFDFMHNEHGLILLQSEMEDIIREAKKY